VAEHEVATKTSRDVIKAANVAGNEGTADRGTGSLKEHEKTAWMLLRSFLK
jgi:starvation-inducible DNA-binding protein